MLCGAELLGTLFGVYDVVEREFGVRWFQPGTSDEFVPQAPTLSIGTFDRQVRPSFEFRWIHNSDWSLKQRMNCYVTVDDRQIGIHWKWHFHTFAILIPPEEYSEKHPEWFVMIDGKRRTYKERPSHGAQLCTTNPEVIDKQRFADLVREWAGLTDNLFIYEYYALGGWSRAEMLWLMVHTIRHDIPFYGDCGARGFYTQVGAWPRSPLN